MREAYNTYQADGFVVLVVSIQESNTAVEDFKAAHRLDNTFLMDSDGTISQNYNIYTTPTTYFINPDGLITDVLPGILTEQWIATNMAILEG